MQAVPTDPRAFADVLVAMGKASRALEQIEAELDDVYKLVQSSERLRRFIGDPGIRSEGKQRALHELVGDRCHPALASFLDYLAGENALRLLQDIADCFFETVATTRRQVSGELISAIALEPEKIDAIEEETGRLLGKRVSLRPRVDRELLGGLYVRVGDFIMDGTVDRQLEGLRQVLMG